MAPGGPELIVRPRRGGVNDRRFRLGLLLLALLVVVQVLAQVSLWLVAAELALVVALFALRRSFLAQAGIAVDGGAIRRVGLFGRTAACRRADVARVLETAVSSGWFDKYPATWLLFLERDGRTLLKAYAENYPSDELYRLMGALGVPWDAPGGLPTYARMRRECPGSFPWASRIRG